jgi:hypothetical protein
LTDSDFAPYTYRFDQEGVHWISPYLRTTTPWESINAVRMENRFWCIDNVEHDSMCLPRRTMTESDQQALTLMFAYYTPRFGSRGTTPAGSTQGHLRL